MPDDEDMEQIVAQILAYEATISPIEFYRHRRSILVRSIRNWRKLEARKFPEASDIRRETQISMVKLRYQLRTGVTPGGD